MYINGAIGYSVLNILDVRMSATHRLGEKRTGRAGSPARPVTAYDAWGSSRGQLCQSRSVLDIDDIDQPVRKQNVRGRGRVHAVE